MCLIFPCQIQRWYYFRLYEFEPPVSAPALARLSLNRTLAAESSLPPLHSTPPLPSTALRAAATSLLPSWSPRRGRWVS